MSAFIKKYKSKNGGTVIQVVFKKGRHVVKTIHVGTAHTKETLEILLAKANEIINAGQLQLSLDGDIPDKVNLALEGAYS